MENQTPPSGSAPPAPAPAPQRPPEWFQFRPSDQRTIQFLSAKILNQDLPLHEIVDTNVFGGTPKEIAASQGYSEQKPELYFFTETTKRKADKWKDGHTAGIQITGQDGRVIGRKRKFSYHENRNSDVKWYLDQYTTEENGTWAVYKLYTGKRPARRTISAAQSSLSQDPTTQTANTAAILQDHQSPSMPVQPQTMLQQLLNASDSLSTPPAQTMLHQELPAAASMSVQHPTSQQGLIGGTNPSSTQLSAWNPQDAAFPLGQYYYFPPIPILPQIGSQYLPWLLQQNYQTFPMLPHTYLQPRLWHNNSPTIPTFPQTLLQPGISSSTMSAWNPQFFLGQQLEHTNIPTGPMLPHTSLQTGPPELQHTTIMDQDPSTVPNPQFLLRQQLEHTNIPTGPMLPHTSLQTETGPSEPQQTAILDKDPSTVPNPQFLLLIQQLEHTNSPTSPMLPHSSLQTGPSELQQTAILDQEPSTVPNPPQPTNPAYPGLWNEQDSNSFDLFDIDQFLHAPPASGI